MMNDKKISNLAGAIAAMAPATKASNKPKIKDKRLKTKIKDTKILKK